ncbi:uncharacterized protein V6R79_024661 [Siganus canaliculatus]
MLAAERRSVRVSKAYAWLFAITVKFSLLLYAIKRCMQSSIKNTECKTTISSFRNVLNTYHIIVVCPRPPRPFALSGDKLISETTSSRHRRTRSRRSDEAATSPCLKYGLILLSITPSGDSVEDYLTRSFTQCHSEAKAAAAN